MFKRFFIIFFLSIFLPKAQYINVDSNYNANDLIQKFLGNNTGCITVSNVVVSGWQFGENDNSYGYFTKADSDFPIEEGIILSTGRALEAPGSFTGIQSATASGWSGDRDLEEGVNIRNTFDATVLEFDFVSLKSTKISFDYMFLSEQYLRIGDPGRCGYTDGFAFLIKKAADRDYKNIAVLPGTQIPITSENVRGNGGQCPAMNQQYFGRYNPNGSAVSFNGQTKILTAQTDVIPGEVYHIKLVIADQGNGLYDSAVILKAGSFTGNINLGEDLTIDNAKPLCKGETHIIDPQVIDGVKYTWYRNGAIITDAQDKPTYEASEAGDYYVEVETDTGCKLVGSLIIEQAPKPEISANPIMLCDNDFDGKYSENLYKYTSQIVRDFDPYYFDVSYYDGDPATTGVLIPNNQNFEFTKDSQDIYLVVSVFGCEPIIQPINFYIGDQLNFNSVSSFEICDSDLNGNETIVLNDYYILLTNESNVLFKFYNTESEAKAGLASTVSSSFELTSNKTIYVRIEKSGYCPNYKIIDFIFKQPKKSEVLKDKVICKNTTTTLDAGAGFTSYLWSNGETTSKIENISVGEYWVDLEYNGCVYRQFVKVEEAQEPIINDILIEGNKATIKVSGGSLPYLYSLDNGPFQSSNVFENITLGSHTIYVQGNDKCSIVKKSFSLINAKNIITPNDDGYNDVIDYSALLEKSEPKFEVYDRNGVLVFKGSSANQFIWNGKLNGRVLPTSSYWYLLEWNEVGNPDRVKLAGWILLKNRN